LLVVLGHKAMVFSPKRLPCLRRALISKQEDINAAKQPVAQQNDSIPRVLTRRRPQLLQAARGRRVGLVDHDGMRHAEVDVARVVAGLVPRPVGVGHADPQVCSTGREPGAAQGFGRVFPVCQGGSGYWAWWLERPWRGGQEVEEAQLDRCPISEAM
jgi:hypothetical protein